MVIRKWKIVNGNWFIENGWQWVESSKKELILREVRDFS